MSHEKLIQYWLETADEDFDTMNVLFANGKYAYSLYFGQIVLERLLKALYAKLNPKTPHAPKSHDLPFLASKCNLELTEDIQAQPKYRPAPLWDFEKGDFATNGANQIVYGSGYDAWVLWCNKTIMTQRWAYMAYSSNIGIEADEAFREPDRKAQESAFERTITEALFADPMGRTQQVHDFQFVWKVDSLYISCVVNGVDGDSATIKVALKK